MSMTMKIRFKVAIARLTLCKIIVNVFRYFGYDNAAMYVFCHGNHVFSEIMDAYLNECCKRQ